jgi:hypothetical protein
MVDEHRNSTPRKLSRANAQFIDNVKTVVSGSSVNQSQTKFGTSFGEAMEPVSKGCVFSY